MAKKIKCPGFLCGSTDVEYLGGNQRTSLNLNPLHPFTLVNTKPKGKQKFRCRKCGKVFEAKISDKLLYSSQKQMFLGIKDTIF